MIDAFVESTRVLVYSSFGPKGSVSEDEPTININSLGDDEKNEMNKCLSQQESMTIVKDFVRVSKNRKKHSISDKKYFEFIEALNARMVSNMLIKLTQDGLLESAFDEESNDFIFWVKEEENENKKDNI